MILKFSYEWIFLEKKIFLHKGPLLTNFFLWKKSFAHKDPPLCDCFPKMNVAYELTSKNPNKLRIDGGQMPALPASCLSVFPQLFYKKMNYPTFRSL